MTASRRLNVHTLGRGTPMLFVHGFGCDQNMWRFLVPHFAQRYRVILVDLVGMGGSDLTAYDRKKYATLHGHAQDMCEVLREEAGGEPAIFVGHSVSAMIGLLASLQCPELVKAQVMVGPSPCYVNDADYFGGFERSDIESLLETLESNYLGWSSNIAPVIMGAGHPELTEELTNSFCRTDPEIAGHFARVTFLSDHRADLPKLQAPTLILQCSDDVIAPRTVGEYMVRHIPHARLAVIENVGHCPHLSAPGASVDAIETFLANTFAS